MRNTDGHARWAASVRVVPPRSAKRNNENDANPNERILLRQRVRNGFLNARETGTT